MLNSTTTRFYSTFEGTSARDGLKMNWMRGMLYVLGAYFVYRVTLVVYRGRQRGWPTVFIKLE